MRNFEGTPGTLTALFLRLLQFLFSAASIGIMGTAKTFFEATSFSTRLACFVLPCVTNAEYDIGGLWTCLESYLLAAMGLQLIWSLGLACLDVCALTRGKVIRSHGLISIFIVGDLSKLPIWSLGFAGFCGYGLRSFQLALLVRKRILFVDLVPSILEVTATLSLAAASSSAGITLLYAKDWGWCDPSMECEKYQFAVALAFLSWITIEITSLIMIWSIAAPAR